MPELRMSAQLGRELAPVVGSRPRVVKYGRGQQAYWPNVPADVITDVEAAADALARDVTATADLRQAARAFLRIHGR